MADSPKRASGGMASPGRAGASLGGFEIIEKVGQGGMGAVFRARQLSMDRIVALKILPQKFSKSEKAKERFLREARICAGLNHANLINGIDCGEAGGYMYFAMEFVEGETARSLLKRKGKLPVDECLNIVRQIAAALEYAHSKKLIHRDVKPDNIMITPGGTAKLCDLGLARSTSACEDSSLTQAGQSVGTPHYISPEQARGEESDERTDIYALGATIYHLLAGKTVFDGATSALVMAQHIAECAPALSEVNTEVSDELAMVVSKMMAKNPADRYAKVAQIVADLDAIDNGRAPAAAQFRGASSCARPVIGKRKNFTTRQTNPVSARDNAPKLRSSLPKQSTPFGLWIGAGLAAVVLVAVLVKGFGSTKENGKRAGMEQARVPSPPATTPLPAALPQPSPSPAPAIVPRVPANPSAEASEPVVKAPAAVPTPVSDPVQPANPPPAPPVVVAQPAPKIEKSEPAVVEPPKNGPSAAEVQLARARFLTEILRRTAKQELTKVRKDAGELALDATFSLAKEITAEELKELDKAIEFEQSALESIAAQKLVITLPAGHPLRALGADKVKVEKYEAHGLTVNYADVQTRLSAPTMPASSIVGLAALKGRDADTVSYLMVRGALAEARSLLPSLTESERTRQQARLDLASAGGAEIAAQVAFEELTSLAQRKLWKPLLEKTIAFEATHSATTLAKQKAADVAAFKAQANEKLNPVGSLFHAKSAKQLPDGCIELSYDFSDPAQLADFACDHGALSVSNGRLVVPRGGGEWAQARFLPPVAEIVRLEVTGKTCAAPSGSAFTFYLPIPWMVRLRLAACAESMITTCILRSGRAGRRLEAIPPTGTRTRLSLQRCRRMDNSNGRSMGLK
jgi:serine/threonine-protein kinase